MRHGTCFHRRLSAHHAGAAPPSAVAELGVVRRSFTFIPRIASAMAKSETNVTSNLNGYVSGALCSLDLLGFAHAGTLAAMREVSPVCPSARPPVRACASLSQPSARRLSTASVRVPACFPGGFPPAPTPRLVSRSQTEQHGPLHAAALSAAAICTRRSALSRIGCRESERTPNHALQPVWNP